MTKYHVTVLTTTQRRQTIEINVRKSEVIDKLGLAGADRHEWQLYVQDYLDDNTDLLAGAKIVSDDEGKKYEPDIVIEEVERAAVSERC